MYRTTSNAKLYKALHILPLDLEAELKEEVKEIKRTGQDIRTRTKAARERKYEELEESSPCMLNFEITLDAKTKEHYLTRELLYFQTGHGPFGDYLKRLRITEDDLCVICKAAPESAHHLLYDCTQPIIRRRSTLSDENEITEINSKLKELVKKFFISRE